MRAHHKVIIQLSFTLHAPLLTVPSHSGEAAVIIKQARDSSVSTRTATQAPCLLTVSVRSLVSRQSSDILSDVSSAQVLIQAQARTVVTRAFKDHTAMPTMAKNSCASMKHPPTCNKQYAKGSRFARTCSASTGTMPS